jgi:A/G-specific adenine glycosylase
MLQQTQVERVTGKYREFIRAFPNFKQLAAAPLKNVLAHWQGLGYNRRALNLRKLAQAVVYAHHGRLPRDEASLRQLPGIGPYTAAAICAFAFNRPGIVIETNVRSVFIHIFFPNRTQVSDAELTPLIAQTLDRSCPRKWYNALMDYGVKIKREFPNPSRRSAHYATQSRFEGSNRQKRGAIVKLLTHYQSRSIKQLSQSLHVPVATLARVLDQLRRDGLVKRQRSQYSLVS